MKMEFIKIPDSFLKEEWWDLRPEEIKLTGHMYFNSPFETCDSCGNCDGARCDYCRELKIPAHYEVAIPSDQLVDILKEITDLPEALIHDLVYDDYSPQVIHNDTIYRIEWPESRPVQSDKEQ